MGETRWRGEQGFEPPVPLTSALNFAPVTDLVRNPADIGRVTSITVLDGNSFGMTGPIETGLLSR
jgi:hypothetical protein